MLFTQPVFLFLFLPILLLVYFACPQRARNFLLILASLFFYGWGEWEYSLILFLMIIANYSLGRLIKEKNKEWVIVAVIFNLAYIFYFKYLGFFATSLFHISIKEIRMPLGVSFVTFHLISYILDIYRGKIRAEKNILDFALYILLFPHLIAGPIVRYIDIGVQIKKRRVSLELFGDGIKRFVGGLAKKVLIANVMAVVADQIFDIFPQYLSGQIVWLALISYSIQIYFDFSGYSDMAIGLAKMFGFTFAENFNYPYIATSIQDFWRRWHMTLSGWFRDYVYIPLGGDRKGKLMTLINIGIVFALTGLWHGANWHFVFWGIYFGFFLIMERLFLGKILDRCWWLWRHIYVLLVVIIGWLFFRISSLSYAIYLLKVMLGINPNKFLVYDLGYFMTGEYLTVLIVALVFITPLGRRCYQKIISRVPVAEYVTTFLLFLFSIMQLAGDTYNPFIYFRF